MTREMEERAKPIGENVTADLAVSEGLKFFREHPEKDLKPTFPSMRPKGGKIYLFFPKDDSCKSEMTSVGGKCSYCQNMAMMVFVTNLASNSRNG